MQLEPFLANISGSVGVGLQVVGFLILIINSRDLEQEYEKHHWTFGRLGQRTVRGSDGLAIFFVVLGLLLTLLSIWN